MILSGSKIIEGYDGFEVGDIQPKSFARLANIEAVLMEGAKLHCFLSGGGLRVVRLEQKDKLRAYGEAPYIEQAFDYCESNLIDTARNHSDFYGTTVPHFLTGSSEPSSGVDRWVRCGRPIDIVYDDGQFRFEGSYRKSAIPKEVYDRVIADQKKERFTDHRGFVYELNPQQRPNGQKSCVATAIHVPKGFEPYQAYDFDQPLILFSDSLYSLLKAMESAFPGTWRD